MLVRLPTHDGTHIAVNPALVRGISPRSDNITMVAFSNGDWIDIGLPFDETLRRLEGLS